MKVNDAVLGIFLVVFGSVVALHAQTFPVMAGMQFGPEFFPTMIGIGMALCGAGLLSSWALASRRGTAGPWFTPPDWMHDRLSVFRALGIIFSVVFYILVVPHLGFILTMFIIALGLLLLLGNPLWLSALVSVALPIILHFGFSTGLRVPLPRGLIEKAFF